MQEDLKRPMVIVALNCWGGTGSEVTEVSGGVGGERGRVGQGSGGKRGRGGQP
jgi:hypothetical protein